MFALFESTSAGVFKFRYKPEKCYLQIHSVRKTWRGDDLLCSGGSSVSYSERVKADHHPPRKPAASTPGFGEAAAHGRPGHGLTLATTNHYEWQQRPETVVIAPPHLTSTPKPTCRPLFASPRCHTFALRIIFMPAKY